MNSQAFSEDNRPNLLVPENRPRLRRVSLWQPNNVRVLSEDSESDHPAEHHQLEKSSKVFTSLPAKMIMTLSGSFFQSLLTIFSCIIYVVGTYENDAASYMTEIELVIAALFAFDYLWGFAISRDKRDFLLNPMNIIDLVTILPVILNLLNSSNARNSLMFARILRILRVIRILRLYRLFTSTKENEQGSTALQAADIKRQIMITIGSILALLFISTGIVHALNKTEYFNINLPAGTTHLTFDATFYYMIITIFTIGYGDFVPTTALARAIIGLFIIIVIIIMSQQTTKLSELMKNSSPYRSTYKTDPLKHIIVSGAFSGTTLFRFIKELYHPDHNMRMKSCKILIVKNESPSREILALLNHPVYEEVIQYLEGDLIDEQILKSSAVKVCKGVFILTDQYMDEVGPSDTYAVLVSSAVKEYSPEVPILLQLVKPDLLIHDYWAGWDTGFSTWQLKLSMMAANVLTPGLSTFMCNLIVSSSGSMKKAAFDNHWMNEYIMGLSNEVYLVAFPDQLTGSRFIEVVANLYSSCNSLLIGVQTTLVDSETEGVQEILLNPVDYLIKSGDNAFIIAVDYEDAQKIRSLSAAGAGIGRVLNDDFLLLKSKTPTNSTKRDIEARHILMWDTDLRGKLWDHILVFGRLEHLDIICGCFEKMTGKLICYVSEQSPNELWHRISLKHKHVLYLECTLSDITELSHTAINFAHHAIILSSKIPGSNMDDSGTLPLINIIENYFKVKCTVELVDEVNMKYMENRFPVELEHMSFLTWPRYAAANIFFSSALDYIIAQGYHNSFIIDLVIRMIIYEDLYEQIGTDENCIINSIEVPLELHGKVTFKDVFFYLLSLERPVIALAIYRGVGILNNEIPYVFTKPDFEAPLFFGDNLIVMGELNNRESSPYLKDARKKMRNETTIKLSRKKSITKASQTLLIKKQTLADKAVKVVEEDDKNEGNIVSDDDLVAMIKSLLDKTKTEREIVSKQNETLLNLASECTTVQNMLNGLDVNESLVSESSNEEA